MRGLFYLFGILCFLYYTYSRPNGAPNDSCFYMTPRHVHPHTNRRVFPTKAMGLYNITTSSDVFRPDRPIRVTLWGPPFKGFLIVAAEEGAKDWPTGIFYSEDGSSKRVSCLQRGDTATHSNNSFKDSVSVLWYGPENMMSEQIQFIATVVVNLTIYYTNIRSGMLRLDPSIHGAAGGAAGGEGGGPVVATMDPWLSGQSVTQAPTNWWNRGAGGAGGSGNAWGAGINAGWGSNAGSNGWGSNTGANNGWGSNTAAGGTWGSNTATGATGGTWGSNSATGAAGGAWGSNTGSGGWGAQTGTGANGGWGAQGTSNNGWSATGTGTANNGWGSANNQGGGAWGNSGWQSTGTGTVSSSNTGANNGWNANGDWQQYGQGSVTASSWTGTQYQNADGSSSWNNGQQKPWHAPGNGRPIWNWNSGKIPTTAAPATTQAPKPAATTTISAWSAQALLELVQRLGFGPVARPQL